MNYYPIRPDVDTTPAPGHPQFNPDGFNTAPHSREIPRPQSPLLSWYGSGNLPPGCVISGGVVTSYHTCDNPAP
jgi:hypothetical protein